MTIINKKLLKAFVGISVFNFADLSTAHLILNLVWMLS